MRQFSIPVRVYLEDTDAGGIVFYANYLKYLERARTDCLREAGIDLDLWQRQHRRLFVVRSVSVDYHAPARFNDQLVVSANIVTLKRASMVVEQPIYRDDTLLISSVVKLACIDADTLSPTAIPTPIKEAMTS